MKVFTSKKVQGDFWLIWNLAMAISVPTSEINSSQLAILHFSIVILVSDKHGAGVGLIRT